MKFGSDRRPVVALVVFFIGLLSGNIGAEPLNIAVAANFNTCAKSLTRTFERETALSTRLLFASTGALYAQIYAGAPFDVFLAADAARPAAAIKAKLALKESLLTYAIGRLALYSESLDSADGLAALESDNGARIAIANPTTAPYGRAALAVLGPRYEWLRSSGRLILGTNVAQAFSFVASGNAEFGLIALAQVGHLERRHYWPVPADRHPPIVQQAVLLSASTNEVAARKFLRFLGSAQARDLIRAHGYDVPRQDTGITTP